MTTLTTKTVPAETVMDAIAQIVQHAGALNALQRFAATGEYRALHDIKTAMVEVEHATARRIGTTRFGCGCTVHVEPDVNGIAPWLEHCARHAETTTLRGLLAEGLEYVDASYGNYTEDEADASPDEQAWARKVRALLAPGAAS